MDNFDHNLNLDTQHRREILQKSINESEIDPKREANCQSVQRYKLQHKKQGLCVDCPRKALPGRIRCLKCIINHNSYKRDPIKRQKKDRELKEYRIKNNLCPCCGGPFGPMDEGKKTCMNCRQHITRPHWAYWHELRVRGINI